MGLEHITPFDEFLEKMRYALQARRDQDFVIIGRTDAYSAVEGSMEEATKRGRALRDLGVDAVMPRGVTQREDLALFREAVPDVPLLVIAGAEDISVKEYEDLGYRIIIYAVTPIIAAATAIFDVYQNLKDTGLTGINAQEVAQRRKRVESIISLPEYYRVEAATTEREYQDRRREG
jgi:methylisocitrate lyase